MALNLKKFKKGAEKTTKTVEKETKGKGKGKAKATAKKEVKTEKRKKASGFEVPEKSIEVLNEDYESLSSLIEQVSDPLNTFLEGKRSKATETRGVLQDIVKLCKQMRQNITETKEAMKPIYS